MKSSNIKLPYNTCPDIDKVIEGIVSAKKEAESIGDSLYRFEDIMEQLRKDNSMLRDACHLQEEIIRDLESQIEELNNQ